MSHGMHRPDQIETFLTTREAARALGVSLRTARLWVENGRLDAWKTEGGHRRISRSSVQQLLDGEFPKSLPKAVEEAVLPCPQRIKVLIVEDDSILLKLYKTIFASWQMPVDIITAGNGIDGLILIGKYAPDLMITDLGMPCMDGIQLIRNLVNSSFRDGIEIVVVSGLNAREIAAQGGLPEGVAFFQKPIPFLQIKSIIDSIVDRRSTYL
jgi:excisionase family DNA binding protein